MWNRWKGKDDHDRMNMTAVKGEIIFKSQKMSSHFSSSVKWKQNRFWFVIRMKISLYLMAAAAWTSLKVQFTQTTKKLSSQCLTGSCLRPNMLELLGLCCSQLWPLRFWVRCDSGSWFCFRPNRQTIIILQINNWSWSTSVIDLLKSVGSSC